MTARYQGARDAALVSLLAHEGIKANELIVLCWFDHINERGTGRCDRRRMSGTIPLPQMTNDFCTIQGALRSCFVIR